MKNPSIKKRITYYFENTMSAGPIGVIKWLAIVSLLIVVILGLIILIFNISPSPDSTENIGFIEGTWRSLMATLDPGTMGGDEGWAYRIIRFIATLGGIFIISILIGTISSGIDTKLDELKKGRTTVLESNHTLILGWSKKIFSIIQELVEANENQKKPSIVILANLEKEIMEDEIRSKISNFKNTKIIIRSGSPLELADIALVNPNEAKSIIVLSPEEKNADTHVIKSVLALTNNKSRKAEPFHIVAEIKEIENMEAAELVGNNEAIFVLTSDFLSRITAQTCRQSGLSVVYSEILQFEGDEIYIQNEPKLYGKSYKEALFLYETSAIMGILTQNEEVLINPPMDTIIQNGDSIIAISEDDDTIILNSVDYQLQNNAINRNKESQKITEKTLILGWNDKGARIVEELDNYVMPGSEILIVANSDNFETEIIDLKSKLKNQNLIFQKGEITSKSTLVNLKTETYDHIILLSLLDMDVQESDAKTLICLLHLRNLSELNQKDYCIVSEMLDITNMELGVVARADDFIVGDNLVSLMISQLSENKNLKKVYDILFEADGSEIYLKPVSNYVKIGEPISFYTVLESAALINETALGYRITANSRNSEKHFGIKLNPSKSELVTFNEDDFIIVLAED